MLATSSNSGAATPRPVAQTPGGAGAAATPATAPRGSDDGAGPLRIPFHVEKKGESTKAPGRADGTRGKGKGVVNAETAASALRSTQDNTVLLADVLRRLAVQGTVQPVGGKGTSVVSRRFHCVHFQPMAALLPRNPLRIHPETFHFPY